MGFQFFIFKILKFKITQKQKKITSLWSPMGAAKPGGGEERRERERDEKHNHSFFFFFLEKKISLRFFLFLFVGGEHEGGNGEC